MRKVTQKEISELVAWARNWTLTYNGNAFFYAEYGAHEKSNYTNNKEAVRRIAGAIQEYASAAATSYDELIPEQDILYPLAKEYGLLTEFKENGIL